MSKADTSLEKWKALYRAAKEFREMKPWEWMKAIDIFGVQNPLTGEIGYCSIMEDPEDGPELAVYLGAEALQEFLNDDVGLMDDPDFLLLIPDCLLVSFEDRKDLEKEQRALIRQMDLNFRGKKAWPIFMRFEAGYLPASIQQEDIQYLTLALRQAKDVCLRFKEDELLLTPPVENGYLVRVSGSDKDRWEDAWMVPTPLKIISASISADELRIQRIRKNVQPSSEVWEVDFFYIPTRIEAERPYYPYAMMIADSASGFIHNLQASKRSDFFTVFPDHLLSCMENNAMVPSEVRVKKEDAVALIQPIMMKLGIKLAKVSRLPAIEEAQSDMFKHLQGGNPTGLSPADYWGDAVMEEYLERSGSELSIFGLYGLSYGCHAAPNPVNPSELTPFFVGEEGTGLEDEKEVHRLVENAMALWIRIGHWDPLTEDLMVPEFEYEADAEGTMYRIHDVLLLTTFFLEGLELGGLTLDELYTEMTEEAESIYLLVERLSIYVKLLEQEKKCTPKQLKEARKAAEEGEVIIAQCIANITIGLKEGRMRTAEKFCQAARGGLKRSSGKVGRNDPCPCGSGRKYKKCCGIVH